MSVARQSLCTSATFPATAGGFGFVSFIPGKTKVSLCLKFRYCTLLRYSSQASGSCYKNLGVHSAPLQERRAWPSEATGGDSLVLVNYFQDSEKFQLSWLQFYFTLKKTNPQPAATIGLVCFNFWNLPGGISRRLGRKSLFSCSQVTHRMVASTR